MAKEDSIGIVGKAAVYQSDASTKNAMPKPRRDEREHAFNTLFAFTMPGTGCPQLPDVQIHPKPAATNTVGRKVCNKDDIDLVGGSATDNEDNESEKTSEL